MENSKELQAIFRLQIFGIIREAIHSVVELSSRITLALLFPALVMVLLNVAYTFSLITNSEFSYWLLNTVNSILWSFGAVACHRIKLLGANSISKFGISGLRWREWRYLLCCFAMWMFFIVIWNLISLVIPMSDFGLYGQMKELTTQQAVISTVVSVPIYILIAGMFGRLGLVLPAAAIDKPLAFADAFRLGKGNGLQLAVLMFVFPFTCELIIAFVQFFLNGLVSSVLQILLGWVVLPLEVMVLSICFKQLTVAKGSLGGEGE